MKSFVTKYRIKILIIIGIILSLTLVVSYGYFFASGKQDADNIIRVNKCLSVKIINESDSLTLDKEYPITDIEGLDKSPYTFTIQNECDEASSYAINLESLNKQEDTLDAQYIKVALASDISENFISKLNDNNPTINYVENSYEAYNLYTGILPANSTKDFEFREWIDYDTTKDQQNKMYESKINVVANPDLVVENNPEIKFSDDGYNTLTGIITGSANTAKYCYSSSNVCTPDTDLTIANNLTTLELIEENNNKMICSNLDDKKIVCTKRISADFVSPIVTATVNNNNTFDPTISIKSNETGIYCVSNDENIKDMNNCIESGDINKDEIITTAALTTSDVYYVLVKDKPGNIGISRSVDLLFAPTENYILSNSNLAIGTPDLSKYICNKFYNKMCDLNIGLFCWDVDTNKQCTESSINKTYFYRGNVEDNYVKFAGFYWRIIRINENGSLRMIYTGEVDKIDKLANKEEVLANGYDDSNTKYTQISFTYTNKYDTYTDWVVFNDLATPVYDKSHIGFMYTFGQIRGNTTSSDVKNVLDNWYANNLTNYSKYMDSKSGFCGDRNYTLSCEQSEYTTQEECELNGYEFNVYNFGAYTRIYNDPPVPQFNCENPDDFYTLKNSTVGNKKLTYPVGLITADELAFAGHHSNYLTKDNYLYTGNTYWTISPCDYYAEEYAVMFCASGRGGISNGCGVWSGYVGVRPVINLSVDNLKISGSGSAIEPYNITK